MIAAHSRSDGNTNATIEPDSDADARAGPSAGSARMWLDPSEWKGPNRLRGPTRMSSDVGRIVVLSPHLQPDWQSSCIGLGDECMSSREGAYLHAKEKASDASTPTRVDGSKSDLCALGTDCGSDVVCTADYDGSVIWCIWEFPKIRGPIIEPKIVGLLLEGHKKSPQFMEPAISLFW